MQAKKTFLFALTYILISLPFHVFSQEEKEDSLHISNIYFKADNKSFLIDSVYKIENDLYKFVELCANVLSDNPLFVWPIPQHEIESPGADIEPNESNR